MIAKNSGKHRRTPEGTRVSVSEIEIPCIYLLCWEKAHKSNVLENIKQCEKYLMFQKARSFILL